MAPEPRKGSECSASGVEAYHLPAGDEDVSQTDIIAIEMGSQDGPRCFTDLGIAREDQHGPTFK